MTEVQNCPEHLVVKLALTILVQRNKHSSDSVELVKTISNLSCTSSAYYRSSDDLIILGCKNINGGGCRFARNKLYSYINTSNTKKFIACADAIYHRYHQSVYIHIFRKCLIDIVERCSYEFLSKYIWFLTTNKMIDQYWNTNRKPNGFKPGHIVKALQIANGNGWTDKALLLFEHLVGYFSVPHGAFNEKNRLKIAEIKLKISQNYKLNFDGQLDNRIRRMWTLRDTLYFGLLIAPKRMHITTVRPELITAPVEQQPWFFGHIPNPFEMASDSTASGAFFVVFQGSKLIAHTRRYRQLPFQEGQTLGYNYYLHNGGVVQYLYLYQFYRSLINQDLDAMRAIQENHNIDWPRVIDVLKQPNPLLHLLSSVKTPCDEIVQYLLDIGVPKLIAPWPCCPVYDTQFSAFDKLLSAGVKIDTDLFISLLQNKLFMNMKQMRRLVDAWQMSRDTSGQLLSFILFSYYPDYLQKTKGIFSERKLTLLWIHKYGQSDTRNYLQTLPKELVRHIIEFIDEQPMYVELATMLVKLPGFDYSYYFPTLEDLQRSHYLGQVIMEGSDEYKKRSIMEDILADMNYKYFRENYYWIRRALCEQENLRMSAVGTKLMGYMMKHETDITVYRHLHRHFVAEWEWPIIDAFKAKNRTALHYYIKERNDFKMPSRDEFEEKIKPPKYTMTYEEALVLVEEILQS